MKIVTQEMWTPSSGIALEESAESAVKTKANVLVIAGPGAGKTELLAQKASYLFQTNTCKDPQKILAISFKSDAAANLSKRVVKRCGTEIETRFVSMTYDAFAKSILDHFRFALPEYLRPNANYLVQDGNIIDAAFKKAGYNNPRNLSRRDLNSQYEQVLGAVQLPFSNNDLGEGVWRLLLKGFDDYQPTLTFKMMCILAEYIIRTNPKIKRGLQLTYKYVFLDEFQDTTDLQYKFVKQCFGDSCSMLTAVGDNKQRIMVWAGARKTVFEDFQTEFNAETQRLIMNHRSAPRLVDLQTKMYASLKETDFTTRPSDKWAPNDGKVTLLMAHDEDDEATRVAQHICERISAGVEPNQLCILCKQRADSYSQKIIAELDKHQIRARVENNYQDLVKESIVELLIALFRLAIDRKNPHEAEFVASTIAELWNVNSSQSSDAYFAMHNRLDAEMGQLNILMCNASIKEDFEQLLMHVLQFLGIPQIKAMFPVYSQGTFLKDILYRFRDYMWTELVIAQMDWTLAIENFEGVHSVPIMTIHKSKGLEYDTVYFVGLEDSAFWNFRNQPEEDRCAFFVALSRAQKEVYFTFCEHRIVGRVTQQTHEQINEFFELLKTPGIATVIQR